MYRVVVSQRCGCFQRSDLENNLEFSSKDDALLKAIDMRDVMNKDFCGKHEFQLQEMGEHFVISFDTEPKSTCCGDGCCD